MTDTPNNLHYSKTHEWIEVNGQEATIGITHHAQELLGDLVFVDLPTIGQQVQAGNEMGVVESVKAASDFYSPMSGEVIEVNHLVNDDPAIVNRDPYGGGWLVKIKLSKVDEVKALLDAQHYDTEIAQGH